MKTQTNKIKERIQRLSDSIRESIPEEEVLNEMLGIGWLDFCASLWLLSEQNY